MSEQRQLCTFRVDGLLLGIDVDNVQEVLRAQDMTPVPLAPEAVQGLINLRGQIVTAIDLRQRLQLGREAGQDQPMNVVLDTARGILSLLVDRIGDVLYVDEATVEEPPPTLAEPLRSLTRSTIKLPEELLLELDTDKTIALAGDPRSSLRSNPMTREHGDS